MSQFPFLPFPFPVPQGNTIIEPDRDIPQRIRVAMEFLQFLAHKTSPRIAVNEGTIEEFPGQKLQPFEINAQLNACELLSDYFKGNLKFDRYEKEQRRPPEFIEVEREDNSPPIMGPGNVIQCKVCKPGKCHPDCIFCKGSGSMLVFPTREK
jgi:hypothetical protein